MRVAARAIELACDHIDPDAPGPLGLIDIREARRRIELLRRSSLGDPSARDQLHALLQDRYVPPYPQAGRFFVSLALICAAQAASEDDFASNAANAVNRVAAVVGLEDLRDALRELARREALGR